MKLLCVIDSIGSGGAQRQLIAIAKGIKANGYSVSFLVYHHEPFYLQELKDENIDYTCLDGFSYIKRIFKMRKHIRNGKFDIVLSFLEGANFITTLAGFPFRTWRLVLGERNANPNILKSKKLRFYRWFHFFTDIVVSNSQFNIDLVKKINPFLNDNKFHVIYNFVDFTYWKPTRKHEYFRNKKYNILVAATHEDRKNANGLLEALRNLDEYYLKRLNIDWYGRFDNSYYETLNLSKKYDLNDVINFHPATKNIKEKMEDADVIGLFSFYEGLPNVICEALSLGKPVICSAVSDLPVILKNTGNILFDPKKTISIVKAIEDLFMLNSQNLEEIGRYNLKLAKKSFDSSILINSYLKLLRNE